MLKGKGKAFAPKFKGRRPATATAISTERLSRERSSQTPAPAQHAELVTGQPLSAASLATESELDTDYIQPAHAEVRSTQLEGFSFDAESRNRDGLTTTDAQENPTARLSKLSHAHIDTVKNSAHSDGVIQAQRGLKRSQRELDAESRLGHPPKRQAIETPDEAVAPRMDHFAQGTIASALVGRHVQATHEVPDSLNHSEGVLREPMLVGKAGLVVPRSSAGTPMDLRTGVSESSEEVEQNRRQTTHPVQFSTSISNTTIMLHSEASAAKPAKPRKKKTPRPPDNEAVANRELGSDAEIPVPRRKRSKGAKGKRTRRARTPEGAEDEEVDHATTKMADLCKDIKIGKKFSKHDEIKQRTAERSANAKLSRTNPEVINLIDQTIEQPSRPESEEPPLAINSGPQMRVVDGQIVIDNSSLQIDRRKRAEAEKVVVEEVEEDEFSRITTSGSLMKRERAQLWTREAEQLFYKGLRMFGTDFEMIAKMFPNRNRRQIKLKFNKEERINEAKISRALIGQKESIDLEEYTSLTGVELQDVAEIEAERAKIDADHNAEQDRRASELAEAAKRKKEAIQAASDSTRRLLATADEEPTGDSAKENDAVSSSTREASAAPKSRKKAAPKKTKRNPHSSRGGIGEVVEILGTIDRAA